jgi:flagellar protein FlbD
VPKTRSKATTMILLTRLDGQTIALNHALIVFAEATPDTVITMTSGQRLLVREKVSEVLERIKQFHRSIHQSPTHPGADHG